MQRIDDVLDFFPNTTRYLEKSMIKREFVEMKVRTVSANKRFVEMKVRTVSIETPFNETYVV